MASTTQSLLTAQLRAEHLSSSRRTHAARSTTPGAGPSTNGLSDFYAGCTTQHTAPAAGCSPGDPTQSPPSTGSCSRSGSRVGTGNCLAFVAAQRISTPWTEANGRLRWQEQVGSVGNKTSSTTPTYRLPRDPNYAGIDAALLPHGAGSHSLMLPHSACCSSWGRPRATSNSGSSR